MGQKVNPIGLRLGVNKTWQSRWYADPREYADLVLEDIKIRKMVSELPECKNADIAEIEIVRHPQRVTIVIHTARPGVIIGVKGASIEKISADIQKQLTKKVQIKIKEIKRADLNANLIAQNIGRQLSGRGSFRKAMKQAVSNAMRAGAQGVKVRLSGRLGGADMSRTEEHKEGRVPLHTLRADIQKQLTKKVQIKIKEIKRADLNANLIAQNIGRQLSGRGSFRKAMKQAVSNAMRAGAQGTDGIVSGTGSCNRQ